MGSCTSREKWGEIENLVKNSCRIIQFNKRDSDSIVKVFHRYSPHFHLSEQQLKEALKEIELPFDNDCQKIYNLFLEHPKSCKFIERQNLTDEYTSNDLLYSVKKLSTFGILLGEGKTQEKFHCLFFTYDIDASNNLSRWEIGVLLADLLEIVLEIIPEIGKIIHSDRNNDIDEYKTTLAMMKKNFLEYFKFLILEDKLREITSEQFVNIMMQDDLKFMVEHSDLRIFVKRNHEKCRLLSLELAKDDTAQSEMRKAKNRRSRKTPMVPLEAVKITDTPQE